MKHNLSKEVVMPIKKCPLDQHYFVEANGVVGLLDGQTTLVCSQECSVTSDKIALFEERHVQHKKNLVTHDYSDLGQRLEIGNSGVRHRQAA